MDEHTKALLRSVDVEQLQKAAQIFTVLWNEIWNILAPALADFVETLNLSFRPIAINAERTVFITALALCEQEHPKWVRIYARTKKRRTRKKYKKRIMQYYMDSTQARDMTGGIYGSN